MKRQLLTLLTLIALLTMLAPIAHAEDGAAYVFPYEGFRFTAMEGDCVLTVDNLQENGELLSALGTTPEVMRSSYAASGTVMEVLPAAGGQFTLCIADAGALSSYENAARMDAAAREEMLASFTQSGLYENVGWSARMDDYLTMTTSSLQGGVAIYRLTYATLRHSRLYLVHSTIIGRAPQEADALALEEMLSRIDYLGRLATPEPSATATPTPAPTATPRPTPGIAERIASEQGLTLIISDMPAWVDEEDLTLTGTTMAGANVRISLGETVIGRATAGRNGAFRMHALLPEEGDLELTVSATLTGQTPASQTYRVRFDRRTAQIEITEPGEIVEQARFYIRGVTEPGATVYAKAPGVSTNAKANGNGVFSLPITMEKEGTVTYALTVRASGLHEGSAEYTITRRFSEKERIADFRNRLAATSYRQLINKPEACAGDRLSFRGRIGAFGDMDGTPCMLLYTRNPSRGVWEEPVWILCEDILSFSEEDMLTVYVTAEGSTIEHEGQMIPVVRLAFYNE